MKIFLSSWSVLTTSQTASYQYWEKAKISKDVQASYCDLSNQLSELSTSNKSSNKDVPLFCM